MIWNQLYLSTFQATAFHHPPFTIMTKNRLGLSFASSGFEYLIFDTIAKKLKYFNGHDNQYFHLIFNHLLIEILQVWIWHFWAKAMLQVGKTSGGWQKLYRLGRRPIQRLLRYWMGKFVFLPGKVTIHRLHWSIHGWSWGIYGKNKLESSSRILWHQMIWHMVSLAKPILISRLGNPSPYPCGWMSFSPLPAQCGYLSWSYCQFALSFVSPWARCTLPNILRRGALSSIW